ncbi:hypothetical protein AB0J86_36995 [Micromonospora sp. NPDC049559]|uniref:hypothetical protein n=1 Tax=Micromonospora sp. NPDC049559 TaxID=3155923 RepID=UPI00342B161E
MRHAEQQTQEQPRDATAAPARPEAADGRREEPGHGSGSGSRAPEDALDDRGSYDTPEYDTPERTGGDRGPDVPETDADQGRGRTDRRDPDAADRAGSRTATDPRVGTYRSTEADAERAEAGEREFHEPAALPTTFGAASVGDAVAASALAGESRATEHDVREENPDRAADGVTDARELPAEPGEARGAATSEPGTATGTATTGGPGSGTTTTGAAKWISAETAEGLRDRWRDVQLRFVDDPRAATGEAAGLLDEALKTFTSALAARRRELDGTPDADAGDTEQLRMVVRRYREFLDRLLDC